MIENDWITEVESLRAANSRMKSALEAISWMQINENTNRAEVLALCMSIAKIALAAEGGKP